MMSVLSKKSLCQLWNPPFSFDFFISQTLLTRKCLYDISNSFTNAFILGSLLNESFWRCLLVVGSIGPSNALDGWNFDSEYVVSQLFCMSCETSHTSWKGSCLIFISLLKIPHHAPGRLFEGVACPSASGRDPTRAKNQNLQLRNRWVGQQPAIFKN